MSLAYAPLYPHGTTAACGRVAVAPVMVSAWRPLPLRA